MAWQSALAEGSCTVSVIRQSNGAVLYTNANVGLNFASGNFNGVLSGEVLTLTSDGVGNLSLNWTAGSSFQGYEITVTPNYAITGIEVSNVTFLNGVAGSAAAIDSLHNTTFLTSASPYWTPNPAVGASGSSSMTVYEGATF